MEDHPGSPSTCEEPGKRGSIHPRDREGEGTLGELMADLS